MPIRAVRDMFIFFGDSTEKVSLWISKTGYETGCELENRSGLQAWRFPEKSDLMFSFRSDPAALKHPIPVIATGAFRFMIAVVP
jgi:hypothetical protein